MELYIVAIFQIIQKFLNNQVQFNLCIYMHLYIYIYIYTYIDIDMNIHIFSYKNISSFPYNLSINKYFSL
jgi:hypothetical protein